MAENEEAGMTSRLRRRVDAAAGEERLDLAREPDRPAVVSVVERLDAEGVARREQTAPPGVPDHERVHTAQALDHGRAVAPVEVQQAFRVAGRAEAASLRFKLRPQLAVIVDLAVEGDVGAQRIVVEGHRLGAGIAQIEDRKPPVRQADAPALTQPKPLAIGPARTHCIADDEEFALAHPRRLGPVSEDGYDAAHG